LSALWFGDDQSLYQQNLMPALLDAARARASVGEIINALADVFGRHDRAAQW
jgi:methylmalonyl-CoA mutase N-terminal domain/subunit